MNAKIVYMFLFVMILGIGGYYVFGSDSAKVSKIEAHQANVNLCLNNPLNGRC